MTRRRGEGPQEPLNPGAHHLTILLIPHLFIGRWLWRKWEKGIMLPTVSLSTCWLLQVIKLLEPLKIGGSEKREYTKLKGPEITKVVFNHLHCARYTTPTASRLSRHLLETKAGRKGYLPASGETLFVNVVT